MSRRYSVSLVETFSKHCFCGKVSQLPAVPRLMSLPCPRCALDTVSRGETYASSCWRPTQRQAVGVNRCKQEE